MIRLVTDGASCLPADLVEEHGIRVVPLHVLVDGQSFVEGVDIDAVEVAAALRDGQRVSTSKPSAGDFLDAYEQLAAEGADHIVSVHLSAAMSGTVSSAELAAADSPVPVTVVDSRSIGLALGFAVVSGAQAAAAGGGAASVAAVARERASGAAAMFYVDTLEHLRRGGRIGRASALVGSALAIKPLLHLSDGEVGPLDRVRTSAKALARLQQRTSALVQECVGGLGVDVAVQHLDADERARALVEALRADCPEVGEIRLVELGAAMSAHVGPGTIGTIVSPRVRTTPPVIGAASV